MKFKITMEGKKSIQSIQNEFAKQLSPKEIRKTTAFALNTTARRVIGMAKKEARKEYTVSNKYLDRMSKLSKPAAGTVEGLYAAVSYSFKTVPMVGFNFKESKSRTGKAGSGFIMINIKKSKNEILKHAFVTSTVSGHKGIFEMGRYEGSKFIHEKVKTKTGKIRITQLQGPSASTMAANKNTQEHVTTYVEKNLPSLLRALLQNKVNKLTK
jgi:hypothetical protein